MGKAPATAVKEKVEKTKETLAPGASGSKKVEGKPAAAAPAAVAAPVGVKGKGHAALPGHCFSWDCKAEAVRYNFCKKHFDHFKFGLLKKTGEPVPDYEKKFEHYLAHQGKRGAQKVA